VLLFKFVFKDINNAHEGAGKNEHLSMQQLLHLAGDDSLLRYHHQGDGST
jgi:hypothetical protein